VSSQDLTPLPSDSASIASNFGRDGAAASRDLAEGYRRATDPLPQGVRGVASQDLSPPRRPTRAQLVIATHCCWIRQNRE
jgi:hypothetical protein